VCVRVWKGEGRGRGRRNGLTEESEDKEKGKREKEGEEMRRVKKMVNLLRQSHNKWMHMIVHLLFPGMLGEPTWLYWGPVGRACPGAIRGGLGLTPWGPIPIPMPPPPPAPIICWRGGLLVGSGGKEDCTTENQT